MSGYGQFCPVAVASEVFARRWTPLILRELLAGSTHFNDIKRGLPLISRTLLAERLRELEAAGIVTRATDGAQKQPEYRLTAAGLEFRSVLDSLGAWGQRWSVRFDARNLDPNLLMWNLRRRLATDRLPARRTVVRFDFTGLPPQHRKQNMFWLIVDRQQVDLCIVDPGDEVDLYVRADIKCMAEVWMGDRTINEALRSGRVQLTGRRELVRAFPSWLLLSKFAAVAHPSA